MSAFRFRLEAVRKLRQRAEEERAGDLAEAASKAGSAQDEHARVEAIERAGREQLQRLDGDVAKLKSVQVMLDHLEQHRDQALEKCHQAEEALQERQTAFVQAVTERRAIERLKDRRQKTWRQEEIRREQKTLDEVTSSRHQRNATGQPIDPEGDQ